MVATFAASLDSLPDALRPPRYAVPQITDPTTVEAPFAELCATLEAYWLNTLFEDLGVAAFDLSVGMDLDDVRPRGLYNPVRAIVDFYELHVLTGRMIKPPPKVKEIVSNPQAAMDLPGGDLWIEAAKDNLIEPIARIWRWSKMQLGMGNIARNAANLGNALLVATEEPGPGSAAVRSGKVYIENVHPASLVDFDRHKRGHFTYARISELDYERNAKGEKEPYVLTREFTPTRFKTFKNGKPFDRFGLGAEWPNPHGFVPVVMIRHQEIPGDDIGLNAYSSSLSEINEMCLIASIIGTLIGMHVNPKWAALGATPPKDGNLAFANNIWFFPEGADLKAVLADLDIAGAYRHLDTLYKKLEEKQPELLLPLVGDQKRDVSGAAVRGILTGLIRRGLRARERYEDGLKDILQMALSMGANFGGSGTSIWPDAIAQFGTPERAFEFHWPDILPLNDLERAKLDADVSLLRLQTVNTEIQIEQAVYNRKKVQQLQKAEVDPVTGFPIDPDTGLPTDPATLTAIPAAPPEATPGISGSSVPTNIGG